MKKLCICRSCKCRFLIEPGRDYGCPDKPVLVTEKEIYLENGFYKIQTHDQSGENTEVLKAALDSITLTQ